MNVTARRFLLRSFLISAPCFGLLLWFAGAPPGWRQGPVQGVLLALGCLGPAAAGAAGRRGEKPPGRPGVSPAWGLAVWLLGLHYGLLAVLGLIGPGETAGGGLPRLVLAALVLGAQEWGWRGVLQPALEQGRKAWKATAAVGLIASLWWLPLLFLPWFPVGADAYLPVAVWLTGLSFLHGALYRRTGSLPCAALFSAGFFLLAGLLPPARTEAFYLSAGLDILLAFLYQSRQVQENTGAGVPAGRS